ncbi:MAG TPA: DUF742 domain-containing protein [Pseudonocardiaceae bacterium]
MTEPEWPAAEQQPTARPRASLARPYSWTEGRTRPAIELPIEALVRTTPEGNAQPFNRSDARSTLIQLCLRPHSTAEVAVELGVPLGVARVLIADLVDSGFVTVLDTLGEHSTWDERHDLIERVLSGLRAI